MVRSAGLKRVRHRKMIIHVGLERRHLALAFAVIPAQQTRRCIRNTLVAAKPAARPPGDARPPHHQVRKCLHLLGPAGIGDLPCDGVRVLADNLCAFSNDRFDPLTINSKVPLYGDGQPGLAQFVAPVLSFRFARSESPMWWPQCGYSLSRQRPERAQLSPDHAVKATRPAILAVVDDRVAAADRSFGPALHLLQRPQARIRRTYSVPRDVEPRE